MITIVFLAGGRSKRMGANKALKPFLGLPLIQRLIDRFSMLEYPMVIVANEPEAFKDFSLPVIEDIEPGHGALGGLLTALSAPATKYIGMIACDMPFANPALLAMEYQMIQENPVDAVVPSTYLGYEPFHAVYHRENCVVPVGRCVQEGDRKMTTWFDDANVMALPIQQFDRNSEIPEIFYNMNTPADWAYAEQIAKNKGMQWGTMA